MKGEQSRILGKCLVSLITLCMLCLIKCALLNRNYRRLWDWCQVAVEIPVSHRHSVFAGHIGCFSVIYCCWLCMFLVTISWTVKHKNRTGWNSTADVGNTEDCQIWAGRDQEAEARLGCCHQYAAAHWPKLLSSKWWWWCQSFQEKHF